MSWHPLEPFWFKSLAVTSLAEDTFFIVKEEIRKKLKLQRSQLSASYINSASTQIFELLKKTDLFINSEKIGCYQSIGQEVKTDKIINYILANHKICFLPVVQSNTLQFNRYSERTRLLTNKYGIKEPMGNNYIEVFELDVILLPLVGFSRNGDRLGMGAGYYDRTLGKLEKTPILIGLAYESQEIPNIPTDEWDISLDYVITNNEVITCNIG